MNNDFQEKLNRYKEGQLSQDDMSQMTAEINKFIAITEYLNDDEKAFMEELKQQMQPNPQKENRTAQHIKRKVNLRIVLLTAFTALFLFVGFVLLYFTASRITTSLFALDHKEIYVKKDAVSQLAQIFQPEYKSYQSSVSSSLFAKQNIRVVLEKNVGNTQIDRTEISVNYRFGKPVPSAEFIVHPATFFYADDETSVDLSGFNVLENAPQGTKAKVFVSFDQALTASEIKEQFIAQLSDSEGTDLDFMPIAFINSDFLLANPSYYQMTAVYPYDKSHTELLKDRSSLQALYESFDNDAHKASLIGNLNLIKNNLDLLQAIYYENMFEDTDFDALITQVENDGAMYVGMYLSADSKALLTFKSNPHIQSIAVVNLVVW
ncbi:anti sigma factor C-terminal domain-containing protein [Fusibacter bizertensis]